MLRWALLLSGVFSSGHDSLPAASAHHRLNPAVYWLLNTYENSISDHQVSIVPPFPCNAHGG